MVEHRFATWHLDPWTEDADWIVVVLRAPGPTATADDDKHWPAATDWRTSAGGGEANP